MLEMLDMLEMLEKNFSSKLYISNWGAEPSERLKILFLARTLSKSSNMYKNLFWIVKTFPNMKISIIFCKIMSEQWRKTQNFVNFLKFSWKNFTFDDVFDKKF